MKENPDNFSENILQNIAEDLSEINSTCTEKGVATQLRHRRRPQRVCRKSREHTPRGSNPGCQ